MTIQMCPVRFDRAVRALLISGGILGAGSAQSDSAAVKDMPGHYCGIYSAAAAMRALGRAVDLDSLISSTYVGSERGNCRWSGPFRFIL